jgi:hypothetical protein
MSGITGQTVVDGLNHRCPIGSDYVAARGGTHSSMRLFDRIRRWRSPAQWDEDHPLTGDERVAERLHEAHWWNEAQNIGGANSWGAVDPNRDFKKPKP